MNMQINTGTIANESMLNSWKLLVSSRRGFILLPLLAIHSLNTALGSFNNVWYSFCILGWPTGVWIGILAGTIDFLVAFMIFGSTFAETLWSADVTVQTTLKEDLTGSKALESEEERFNNYQHKLEIHQTIQKYLKFRKQFRKNPALAIKNGIYENLINENPQLRNIIEGNQEFEGFIQQLKEPKNKSNIDLLYMDDPILKYLIEQKEEYKKKAKIQSRFIAIMAHLLGGSLALCNGIAVSFAGWVVADLADLSNEWVLLSNIAIALIGIGITNQYNSKNMEEMLLKSRQRLYFKTMKENSFSKALGKLFNETLGEWSWRKTIALTVAVIGSFANLLFVYYAFHLLLPYIFIRLGVIPQTFWLDPLILTLVSLAGLGSTLDIYRNIKRALNSEYIIDDTQSAQKYYKTNQIKRFTPSLHRFFIFLLVISFFFSPTSTFSAAMRLQLGLFPSIALAMGAWISSFFSSIPVAVNKIVRAYDEPDSQNQAIQEVVSNVSPEEVSTAQIEAKNIVTVDGATPETTNGTTPLSISNS